MIRIRALTRGDDAAVLGVGARAADYLALETGGAADGAWLDGFWQSAPPGRDPAEALRLGLWRGGRLDGIAELAFGYPEAADAYIGLLLLAAEARGQELGARLLARLDAEARGRGARRLLLAVLDVNPRGRAFWERHGFRVVATPPPVRMGAREHVVHRMARALDA